jgi:hypothetical protein
MLHLIEQLIILNQPHRDRRQEVMKRQDFLFFWLRE